MGNTTKKQRETKRNKESQKEAKRHKKEKKRKKKFHVKDTWLCSVSQIEFELQNLVNINVFYLDR